MHMEPLQIEGTKTTPTVKFDGTQGFFEIKGKSNPSNTLDFYKLLYDWLDEYAKAPAALSDVHILYEYFNTSTSKCLLTFFKKLEDISRAGKEVVINWHYEKGDGDMLEAGKDFSSIIHLPFKLVEIPE
jgi:hypothetical protein